MPQAVVRVNAKQVIAEIEARHGREAMRRRARTAMLTAARNVLVPAVRAEVPIGDSSSPWRGRARPYEPDAAAMARNPGPMSQRVRAKSLRTRRPTEAAAVLVDIKHYAIGAVVRGAVSHRQPRNPYFHSARHPHPGFAGNDIFGRARQRAAASFATAVMTELRRAR